MNYRHSFHAGNFADLQKHAVLLALLDDLQGEAAPLTVIDTHAGGGLYDLSGDAARSREAEAGIARLMTAAAPPGPLAELKGRVAARNPEGAVRWYPGSPLLVAERLRSGDRYRGYELRLEEHARLAQALAGLDGATARNADGYAAVAEAMRGAGTGRTLVLIDPPFEQPDDHARAAEATGAVVSARPGSVVAVWTPIKDLETFDGFLRRLAAEGVRDVVVAELRLRPPVNPMKMNGCAMVMVNASPAVADAAGAVGAWLAAELGEAGGRGDVWRP